MTITTTSPSVSYVGDGESVDFAIPFPFYTDGDVRATVGGVAPVFTIGGTYLRFATAPAVGAAVRVFRVTPRTQLLDLYANGAFPAEGMETALDRIVMMVQELEARLAASEARLAAGPTLLLDDMEAAVEQLGVTVQGLDVRLAASEAHIAASESRMAASESRIATSESRIATSESRIAALPTFPAPASGLYLRWGASGNLTNGDPGAGGTGGPTFTRRSFAGTAGQTVFALGAAPAAVLTVSVGGIVQPTTAYSIAGQTVVLSAGLPVAMDVTVSFAT